MLHEGDKELNHTALTFDGKLVQAADTDLVYIENESGNLKLMQYTGLKDKNGKEIYEGDIVMTPNYNYDPSKGDNPMVLSEIRYVDGAFVADDLLREHKQDDREIIGNIYENPELMQGGVSD